MINYMLVRWTLYIKLHNNQWVVKLKMVDKDLGRNGSLGIIYAYGAAHTLQEILTVKSDDMIGRNKVYSAITHGKDVPKPSIPESFRVFTRELTIIRLYVELIDKKLVKTKQSNHY